MSRQTRQKLPDVKLTKDFLDTVTALLHTPPMPKGKRKPRLKKPSRTRR